MKVTKRLAATAHLNNNPFGIIELTFDDYDGGDFSLHPQTDGDAIYLPDPYKAQYALKITGNNPEVLKRVGNALLALARAKAGDTDADESSE